MTTHLMRRLPWVLASALVAVACSQASPSDSARVAQLEATIQALQQPPTATATLEPTPTDARVDLSNEHLSSARDYYQAGSAGLSLVELDQALAIWPENPEALDLQSRVSRYATAQAAAAQVAVIQATAQARLTAQIQDAATVAVIAAQVTRNQAATATQNGIARASMTAQAAATREFINRPLLRSRKQDFHWNRSSGYVTAEGQVTNISNQPLRNVTVVVSFRTADGAFVKSTEAVISYDPILPGQTSPWKATTSDNPAMSTARIDYKELLGGSIKWESMD